LIFALFGSRLHFRFSVGISLLVSLMVDSEDEDQSEDEMCEIDCDDHVDGDDLFAF
jgi:hypothetical protein